MKYLSTYRLFESEVLEKPKSKSQLKNELWHKNNPDPVGTIQQVSDLNKYGIPKSIQDMMSGWNVIFKSPYGKSFYSSTNISWSHKPDESYRVSDHWNFTTNRNNGTHCRTDIKVQNNTHYSIGKYNRSKGLYEILLSEPTEGHTTMIKNSSIKRKYLQDPETIYRK